MLSIEGLSAGYDRLQVLHDVSISVDTGVPTVVMGANAAGKTTLCRVITGLIPARSGRLMFDSEDITHLSAADRVRRVSGMRSASTTAPAAGSAALRAGSAIGQASIVTSRCERAAW